MIRTLAVLALILPFAPAPAEGALPPGCREEAGSYVCEFRTTTQDGAVAFVENDAKSGVVRFPVVAFPRSVATMSVSLEGHNEGWLLMLWETGGGEPEKRLMSRRVTPSEDPTRTSDRDTSIHYFEADATRDVEIGFRAAGWTGTLMGGGVSVGEFVITYTVAPLTPGVAPPRPAATLAQPHLRDDTGDVAAAWLDAEAFWFDDAELGDGLMDAHLKVADLEASPPPSGMGPGEFGYFWDVAFRVQEADYIMRWVVARECATTEAGCILPDGADEWAFVCGVMRVVPGSEAAAVTHPVCTVDLVNSTLHAVFPEAALGDPGDGSPFTDMRLLSGTHVGGYERDESGGPLTGLTDRSRHEDEATGERFPFALGGPDVWCEHRAASCVPAAAWYEAPLAADNLPNTLQVLGAVLAAGAFLGGLLLLARRRSRLRRLLADLDRIVAAHRHDAAAGLLALGTFEDALDARLRAGRVTETEYQTVAHRLARDASRLSMRRDLGLDDGEPGEAAADVGVVR